MKPLKIALTPTGNRRLNELVGVSLIATAGLLLLSLVSYRPTDPSFNTVGSTVAYNWAGILGATLSDLLFQFEGFAAFCLPLMLGLLGISWIRSRAIGAPKSKIAGFALFLFITPAVFGLLPGHMHWLGAIPVEGVLGRRPVDGMTAMLNYPGTCVLVATLLLIAVLLSTAFSFGTCASGSQCASPSSTLGATAGRTGSCVAPRSVPARAADKIIRAQQQSRRSAQQRLGEKVQTKAAPAIPRASWLSRVLHRPERPQDDAASLRASLSLCRDRWPCLAGRCCVPRRAGARAIPVDADSPRHGARSCTRSAASRPTAIERLRSEQSAAEDVDQEDDTGNISIGERADADAHPVTLTPRAVSGYRLPPSTLLHRSDDQADHPRGRAARRGAKVLVEKCAEFACTGHVTQINPGPVVTTFEFRPEAGVKYSRVTGLADDLCLAMAAETILIERMAGKSRSASRCPTPTRDHLATRCGRGRDLRADEIQAAARDGQRHQRPHCGRGSGDHAACAHRRFDRQRQIGGHQRHDHVACSSKPHRNRYE